MGHWVQASYLYHVPDVMAMSQGTACKEVDMALEQVVRVFIVATEHEGTRVGAHQTMKRLKIASGTPLPDDDLHA
jgi:hypothetical protein